MKTKPLWSLLHATYGRPDKAKAAKAAVIANTDNRHNAEYMFAVNYCDSTAPQMQDQNAAFVAGDFRGSAAAWNMCAMCSKGDVLIQMQDDLELPPKWDSRLLQAIICQAGFDWPFKPVVVALSDGYRKDGLLCTAICNRARYEQQGEFLHPGYISVFSDDEWTYRALRDERDGKCTIVRAPEIIFRHRHHYHDNSVPMDDTYRRENSAEAYRIGGALFAERNPRAATDGLRTWQ